jgi:hypothetical protein
MTHVTAVTTISYELSQTRHVAVRSLQSSSDVSHSALLPFKPCVLSLCQLNLYIPDSTLSLRFCVARFASPFQLIFCRFSAIRHTFRFFSNVISLASRFPTCAPSAIIDVLRCFKCCKFIHLCVIAFVIRRTFTVTPPGLFSRISRF